MFSLLRGSAGCDVTNCGRDGSTEGQRSVLRSRTGFEVTSTCQRQKKKGRLVLLLEAGTGYEVINSSRLKKRREQCSLHALSIYSDPGCFAGDINSSMSPTLSMSDFKVISVGSLFPELMGNEQSREKRTMPCWNPTEIHRFVLGRIDQHN